MHAKVIVPTRIEVEQRSGADILVVEDGNRSQYTTPDPYLVNWAEKDQDKIEDKYIGEKWKIAYSITDDGYKDFEGFLSKAVNQEKQESVEERVENLDKRMNQMEQKLAQVTSSE